MNRTRFLQSFAKRGARVEHNGPSLTHDESTGSVSNILPDDEKDGDDGENNTGNLSYDVTQWNKIPHKK